MKYKVTDTQLSNIADAIRTKTGNNSMLEFPNDFVSEVNGITAKIKSQTNSVEITFTSLIQVGPGEVVKMSSSVHLPTYSGPVKNVSMSPIPPYSPYLKFFTTYENGNYDFYMYNTGNTAITINRGTRATCSFNKYSASL